jgi:DNA-binding IclR family transcriptional regulator
LCHDDKNLVSQNEIPAIAEFGVIAKSRVKRRAPPKPQAAKALVGSQTLVRGLDVLEAVSQGATNLAELAETLKLNRSTTHRLAATLVEQRYLSFAPRVGYALGPKLLELGYMARDRMSFPRIARDHIEVLAAGTGDTVHLGILDDTRALYLDKIPGRRRVEIRSRIGDRHPLRSTGLGKRMREYAKAGYALDLEENEDRIRCVAAPVRDATETIVGAISVSSAAQYMDDVRMKTLVEEVRAAANAISRDMGWRGERAAGRA